MTRNDPEDTYTLLEKLGTGSFGTVYKAINNETKRIVAIKQIDLEDSDDDISEIQQEIALLSQCDSQYITRYYGSFVKGFKLWIVMEYLSGGSCLDLLKPGTFDEQQIAIVCRELLLGLDYLHRGGKIHRDIKAANILLSAEGKVKLADFGVAAQLSNNKSKRNTFVGTPFWMAPEADIWSLGITAMELAKGEPPLAEYHPMRVLFLIPKAKPPVLDGPFSAAFKDFISLCLTKKPENRPTAEELLRHRFIKSARQTTYLQDLIDRLAEWRARGPAREESLYTPTVIINNRDNPTWIFDTTRSQVSVKSVTSDGSSTGIFEYEESVHTHLENGTLSSTTSSISSSTSSSISSSTSSSISSSNSTVRLAALDRQGGVAMAARAGIMPNHRVNNNPITLDAPTNNSIQARSGSGTLRPPRQFSLGGSSNSGSSLSSYPRSVQIAMPETREGFAGRQLVQEVVIPAIAAVKANELRASELEALSMLEKGVEDLDHINPELVLNVVSEMLSRIKLNEQLSNNLSDLGILPTNAFATAQSQFPPTPTESSVTSGSSNDVAEASLSFMDAESIEKSELSSPPDKPPKSPITELLFSKWIEPLKQKWS
ncbi:10881_t:CDS:2 [Paraglomus brasilianum]|uniref:non-specific serine/threonine protein kinase n=1 Tax=Paraglomus brasilianum TaxID=144538 RepID=A0A9N9BAN4_9GLOM|nr:10881_t:CDS:2 [Paraglomus brasilianum]